MKKGLLVKSKPFSTFRLRVKQHLLITAAQLNWFPLSWRSLSIGHRGTARERFSMNSLHTETPPLVPLNKGNRNRAS